MFEIKYEILEDRLKKLSDIEDLIEFEHDFNEFVGQLRISINDKVEGFIDKEIPYEGEFISEWLYLLNKTICYLAERKFVSIRVPDSKNIRFEFELKNKGVKISKIRAQSKEIINHIRLKPVEQRELFWEEIIYNMDFCQGVLDTTEKFLKQVEEINENLLKLEIILRLKQTFLNAKKVFLTR